MFTTIFVQPIFNLLVVIYALLPGHNFGLSIIIFTIIVRLLMWPLVKKQLHHAKAMRELQPELKRIKQESKGDRQKESALVMELYKEREINPFASIGLLIVQLPILLALYSCISRIISDPSSLVNFTYPVLQNMGWLQTLASDIHRFDSTLFGFIDLTKAALPNGQPLYIPAFLLVAASALTQYYQSKQLMPNDKDARGLRAILREAGSGKQADQSEVNAAVGRSTRYFIPVFIFLFTLQLPAALSLYWATSGLIAILQQGRVLKDDEKELEALPVTSKDGKQVIEGEVINPKTKTTKKTKPNKKKRRR